MTKKSLLVLVFGFSTLLNATANNYRVFYYVRDKHGVHGPIDSNPRKPYAGSIQASSVEEARRQVLKIEPNAIQIEISKQD